MNFLVEIFQQFVQSLYNLSASLGIPSYGLAIIFFTIIVKLLLFPLTMYQLKSMKKLQDVQPKMKEIQDKYKNDKEKMNQEMLELYQKHKVNPMSGCLPLLIQLPIFWALFSSLREFFDPKLHPEYVNLSHAKFFWIPNLGLPDPIFILPVLVAIFMFISQKIAMPANSTDQTQKTMLYVMPLFMAYVSKSFPAGLCLYWVVYNIIAGIEQFVIKRQPGLKGELAKK